MAKITKREYNRLKAELQAQINSTEKKIKALDKWSDALDWDNISVDDIKKFDRIGDYWNSLHDKHYELEQELKFLVDRWDRRNWTGSDWNAWERVTSNID